MRKGLDIMDTIFIRAPLLQVQAAWRQYSGQREAASRAREESLSFIPAQGGCVLAARHPVGLSTRLHLPLLGSESTARELERFKRFIEGS
jgi:hypothetical protein